MNRPWKAMVAFAFAAVVLIGAMVLLTVIGIRLDNNQQLAESRAELEQRVRLALWRMDATVGPIVATENARPYFEYVSFYSAERAYTNMFAPLDAGDVLVPSPLLTIDSPFIRMHFQYAPGGTLSSPSIPESNMRDIAETGYLTHETIENARDEFERMRFYLTQGVIQDALAKGAQESAPELGGGIPQDGVNSNEYEQRAKSLNQSITNQAFTNKVSRVNDEGSQRVPNASSPLLQPFWLGDELFLARSTVVDGEVYLQGCWLNWPAIRSELLLSIADLIPNATLIPALDTDEPENGRRLAAAPIHLKVDEVTLPSMALSPLRIALSVAWVCVVSVIVAIGVLLWGTMTLSERRATFVSAVTHELRTPLTTFQLYTDMLAENRVSDEQKRQSYFETLRNEATRLRHLVENVLAFARLERTPAQQPLETINVANLAERIRPGIESQCSRVGMQLQLDGWNDTNLHIETNAEMLEQIITNLVDNACKYAAMAEDKRITLACRQTSTQLILSVRDYGPGLHPDAARKLFRPFAKSATEAASSAPGIGLGLALSRRLARSLGGDLRWRNDITPGCCFECALPVRGAI